MNIRESVAKMIALDKERKDNSRRLNSIKADLQGEALKELEDKNVRFIRYRADNGSCVVTDAMTLDILNPQKLREALPEGLFNSKVTVEMKPAYKPDTRFEKMLKDLFNGDYMLDMTLQQLFLQMHPQPDAGQQKVLLKKLKGNYEKDREVLNAVFPDAQTDWDVELWHICRIKNGELIKQFLGEDNLTETIEKIKQCILVESKLSIKLEYGDGEEEPA